ncbi:TIGR03085 family metal-binding protein [Rhodococcus artemisiae]|uniref:TIGR03085 family metal-binding protein n=1 Tax=Rhodococcus artemisiae TaxID=714159 RepID=A0ABU7L4C9_9NOCA|nr:TIGR03085 family metal-binding protein [Rhodococcus artemisiae]MEE2056401.1 TIGR03085 family metal-binding protein [Rhodococcus artemisiae]
MSLARRERHALVKTMSEVGPEARTLCGDWTTRDLAAHLLVRERRIDAMPGIMLPALADHTEKVRRELTDRQWAHLLADIDSGPPKWSPLYLVDSVANATEMFVHHEDVRRGESGWEPRRLSAEDQDALWKYARAIGRTSYGGTDITVVFERPGGDRVTVRKRGPQTVVLRGEPSELLLHAFGRDEIRLEQDGSEADIAELTGSRRGL